MRRALALGLLVACADDTTPPWQLAHDRVVAVRATPPGLLEGDVARLTGLVARAGEPTIELEPTGASAPDAPADLFLAVHFNIDHWEVTGQSDAMLAPARRELGLPDGAPVPLDIVMEFPGPLFAQKTVWLGEARTNPVLPAIAIDGAPAGDDIVLARDTEARFVIEVAPPTRVRWLTSCGTLVDDDHAIARLRVDGTCIGELAVVIRDAAGGIVWRVFPIRAQ